MFFLQKDQPFSGSHVYLGCPWSSYEPGSKLVVLGMTIPPLMTGILIIGISTPAIGLMSLSPIIWK